MFGVAGTARIWLWSGPCDLRYGIDRLSGLVEEHFGDEILSGAYFVFLSRSRDKVKVLWWDRDGHCLWLKRLARGSFTPPKDHDGQARISPAQLQLLLHGVTPRRISRRWEKS